MRRICIVFLFTVSCSLLFSTGIEAHESSCTYSRNMLSVHVGYAADLAGGQGYSAFISSSSFISSSPFYYGFSSLLGSFPNTDESLFETGVLIGYVDDIGGTDLYYDLFFDLLLTGGRITGGTSAYRAEAPALHLGASLGFPASSGIDGSVSIAPVIRPYDKQSGLWDFSRSYLNLSVNIRMKSLSETRTVPWEDFPETPSSKNVESISGGTL